MTEASATASPSNHKDNNVNALVTILTNDHAPVGDLLSAALAYARKGWRVIPVHPETKIPCDPVSLFPLRDWQTIGSTDASTLAQWFGRPTRAGIGIATGRASGLVVVDVDSKEGKNGEAAFAFLQERLGPLPETLTAITPSGGRHLVFKYPSTIDTRIGNTVNLGTALFGEKTHVDIRAEGGQINVAPTCRDGNSCDQCVQGCSVCRRIRCSDTFTQKF